MTPLIRRATPDDARFLAWVALAATRSHLPRGFWDLFLPESEEERLGFLEQMMLVEKPSWWHWSLFWIAEHEGRPAAALSGFDPERLLAPNTAVPAFASAWGMDADQLRAAFTRCAPLFTCFHEPAPGAWVVESVATRPEARGLGLGDALVRHVLAEGAAQGHALAQLSLMIGNVRAQRLYERSGFAITAEKRAPEVEAALGCPGVAQMSCPLGEPGGRGGR